MVSTQSESRSTQYVLRVTRCASSLSITSSRSHTCHAPSYPFTTKPVSSILLAACTNLGWTLIASGGTAKTLRDNAIPVTEVADYTGSPEILGGRVKTLHPAIHGGLLARSTEADHTELLKLGWDYIDLVAVNLYPFEATIAKPDVTFDEAIENIDIGGVTLIRAAAKNHQRVTLVCDPADYSAVLDELQAGGVSERHAQTSGD